MSGKLLLPILINSANFPLFGNFYFSNLKSRSLNRKIVTKNLNFFADSFLFIGCPSANIIRNFTVPTYCHYALKLLAISKGSSCCSNFPIVISFLCWLYFFPFKSCSAEIDWIPMVAARKDNEMSMI